MPSPYRHDVERLKAEIAGRVEAGESLRGIGREAGMPGGETVRAWARADAGFAAALDLARVRAAGARHRFDEAKAEVFVARARAREPIAALLRDPEMPGRRTYQRWLASPTFAEAIHALRQRRAQEMAARARARYRAWDPALGDRIIVGVNKGATLDQALAADPRLPCRTIVRRWRREQPEFDGVLRMIFAGWRRNRIAARGCTPELTERIVSHIVQGGSFNSAGREPGIPSRVTLRRWNRLLPDFARQVAQACDDREDWYRDQILLIAESVTPETVEATRRAMGPLMRQLVRLRHRPGAVHRRPVGLAPRGDWDWDDGGQHDIAGRGAE